MSQSGRVTVAEIEGRVPKEFKTVSEFESAKHVCDEIYDDLEKRGYEVGALIALKNSYYSIAASLTREDKNLEGGQENLVVNGPNSYYEKHRDCLDKACVLLDSAAIDFFLPLQKVKVESKDPGKEESSLKSRPRARKAAHPYGDKPKRNPKQFGNKNGYQQLEIGLTAEDSQALAEFARAGTTSSFSDWSAAEDNDGLLPGLRVK